MASEPINIFSHRIDPAGVVELLRDLEYTVQLVGPEHNWSQLEFSLPGKGLLRRPKRFALAHNAGYYGGDNWAAQLNGMGGYFVGFPDGPHKDECLQWIRSFRFALSVNLEDLDIDGKDGRLQIVYAIANHLQGAIFTPNSLRDARGRLLLSQDGRFDADAEVPEFPVVGGELKFGADDDEGDDEDDGEADPPTPERVAARAFVLTAVVARASMEKAFQEEADPTIEEDRLAVIRWVKSLGIRDELEPQEWKVLERPVGKLENRDLLNAHWRVESLTMLAWALGRYSMPEYDELTDLDGVIDAMGLLDEEASAALLKDPKLRSPEELETMQDHQLALHWRVRDYSLQQEPMDFVEFSKNSWFGGFDLERFRVINGDLAIDDVEICKAGPDEVNTVQSIVMERHLAINWLVGDSEIFSEQDTST